MSVSTVVTVSELAGRHVFTTSGAPPAIEKSVDRLGIAILALFTALAAAPGAGHAERGSRTVTVVPAG